jgi:chromate transporter
VAASPLREIALLYLKLGTIAFGGPAAHIALFEDEVVGRRHWLTREQFLDYLGAANLLPGPSSTEMAIYLGRVRAGTAGLIVAGTCFILPAAVVVGVLAWAYVRFGRLPAALGLLYGVKPVIIAIVLQALWRLGRTAVKGPTLAALGIAAAVASALGTNVLLDLIGTGVAYAALSLGSEGDRGSSGAGIVGLGPLALAAPLSGAAGLGPLFLVFLKIGATVMGSGYVLLAFLRADVVEQHHWLTASQLLDAVAVGQLTPGPVFTTATFIGYVVAGLPGAVVATLGIFLPGFLFVAASGSAIARLRGSPLLGAALDGVNVGAVGLIAVVTWQLGRTALVDATTALLAFGGAVLLFRYRMNPAWLVLGGAVVGVLTSLRL